MMRTVHLHGPLAESWGAAFNLDVDTPAEAVRALITQLGPKFRKQLRKGEWHIVGGNSPEEGVDYSKEEMIPFGLGSADLHIAPAVSGSDGGGFFKAILGVALVATSFMLAPPSAALTLGGNTMAWGGMGATAFSAFGQAITWGNLAMTGGVMVLSGAASMLSPTPKLTSGYHARESAEDKPSFLFNGPRNTKEQGGPVPVIYGKMRVGGTLISSGMTVEQLEGDHGGSSIDKPDTLRSKAVTRGVFAIGEGEIGGLVDGAKSIYFGDTPLMAADGSYNFEGVTWEQRVGTPDQDYIPGYTAVENEIDVSTEVSSDTPVVRSITDTELDAARIRLQLADGLLKQKTSGKGGIVGYSMDIAIDLREQGGEWEEKVTDTISGKASGEYERDYRLELTGAGPWDVRVRKVTEDADTLLIKDTLVFKAITEIIDEKLTYPNTALIGLTLDSEKFGSTVPQVSFEVYGRIVQVPVNYDPETRTYDGAWDGTFKLAWTDNPAWCIYDMITHTRYGLGVTSLDKWELYLMSQYCDELVDDGYGGTEPRFRFNYVFTTREEAYHVINTMVAACNTMIYWGSGSVAFAQDRPEEPTHLVVPAKVEGGKFRYQSTSAKTRYTVAMVTYNDPNDGYRATVEPVENEDGILKYGWQPEDIVDVGSVSKGQSVRKGRWETDTNVNETRRVSFVGGYEYADVVPGKLIKTHDRVIAGVRMGGQIKAATVSQVTIDAPITIEAGEEYVVSVVLPDGTSADVDVTNSPGETSVLDLAEPLSQAPQTGALWAVSATSLQMQLFRVLGNRFLDVHRHEITGQIRDPNKFARIEQGLNFDPVPVSTTPTGLLTKPTTILLDEYLYPSGEVMASGVLVSWDIPKEDTRVTGFEVHVLRPGDVWEFEALVEGCSHPVEDTEAGSYGFRVRSRDNAGGASKWLTVENRNLLGLAQAPNDVTGLVLVIKGKGGVLAWDPVEDWRTVRYEVRRGTSWDVAQFMGRTSECSMPTGPDGTYMVRAIAGGKYSDNPTTTVVDGGNLTDNVVATLDEKADGWDGTLSGFAAVNTEGNLWLTGASMDAGTYRIPTADIVSLSDVNLCKVTFDYDVYAHGIYDDVYDIPDVYAVENVYGEYGQYVAVTPQIRLYKNGSWGDWQKFIPGEYAAEQYDFQVVLSTTREDVTPVLTKLVIIVDVPDHNERAEGVTVTTSGLPVTFDREFNAVPTVVCQVVGATGGEDVVVSNITTTGFDVVVEVGGTAVARTINWIAQGY